MLSTEGKTLRITLFVVIFAVAFLLEVRQGTLPSASTTAGLRNGSLPR
jgi:hypothetical protein